MTLQIRLPRPPGGYDSRHLTEVQLAIERMVTQLNAELAALAAEIAAGGAGGGASFDTITAGVNIAAGQFVNIYDDAGTAKVRLADAALDRVAHGFVLAAVTAGNPADVYGIGQLNDQMVGMTPGATQWLSVTTPGDSQSTTPTGSGEIVQALGDAINATEMRFTGDTYTVLA